MSFLSWQGLGKTFEAIAGAILYNSIRCERGLVHLPNVVVLPNDQVMHQWQDELVQCGVSRERSLVYRDDATLQGFDFVLVTRYTIQTEVKRIFDLYNSKALLASFRYKCGLSKLFPQVNLEMLLNLKAHYESNMGRSGRLQSANENIGDTLTLLFQRCAKRMESRAQVFGMVIFDEAHLLRNRCTLWGIGGGLLSMHATRRVPMTGTPYNNSFNDLATLMAFIDSSEPSAYSSKFWDHMATPWFNTAVKDWRRKFMVRRRKDILRNTLPEKHVLRDIQRPFKAELCV